jgi:zinc/manganese transport system permease protein
MTEPLARISFQSNWWEVMQAPFMRHALIGGTIVALTAGLIGYFVIVRTSAFAAHALAHIGFPGATGAVLVGVPVTLGLAVFCIGGGLAIGVLGRRAADREISTGTVLAFATGLGVLFSSLATENAASVTNVLFGNLLAITTGQLWTFGAFLAGIALVVGMVFRPLLFSSVDGEVASARGVPVRALDIVFMVALALAITMAVQAVGTLLLFALVVTPSAAALTISARPAVAVGLGALISVLSVWIGLVLSAMFNLPPSFFIVTLACAVWLGTWLGAGRARRRAAHAIA